MTLVDPIGRGVRVREGMAMISTAPQFRLSPAAAVAAVGRFLPKGWGDLGRQLALFAAVDLAYEASRILARGDHDTAFANTDSIVAAERSLGMFHELDLQRWAMDAPSIVMTVANWTYFNAQFTISFAFLFWVYMRRNDAFPTVRNLIVVANVLGLVGYVLYPAAPPRLM